MACRDGGLATTEWREPASSDRLPIHRSESPTGYSSAGCSPAEPASASPVTDNSSPNPIQRANQIALLNSTARMLAHSRSSCPRQRGVSSLLCTPGDISILRRQKRFGKPEKIRFSVISRRIGAVHQATRKASSKGPKT